MATSITHGPVEELKKEAQKVLLELHRVVHLADLPESDADYVEYLTLIDSMKMTKTKLEKYVGLKKI
jgi:hypothetical protein